MFEDRQEAGFILAKELEKFANKNDVLILGMARGGVVVAKVISIFLDAPLDTLVVKKIGAPENLELAIGAVAPKGTVYWNKELVRQLGIKSAYSKKLLKGKKKEREEQERHLRGQKPLEISNKTVILVDDGIATGASVLAASTFLRKERAKKIILAAPVAAKDTLRNINRYFDMIIVLKTVNYFHAVGQFYRDFPQVENEEVIKLLNT